MITSLKAFSQRFVDRQIGQRLSFHVLGSWPRLRLSNDHAFAPNQVIPVNGILLGALRPAGKDLHKIKLLFRDLIVGGVPFPFSLRRRSRKEKKHNDLMFIHISLTDIVWTAGVSTDAVSLGTPQSISQPRGLASGLAGFLAGILPAPGPPPDDQKTPASEGSSLDPTGASRTNHGLGQREVNAHELFAHRAWRMLKRRKRAGRMSENDELLYAALVHKLEGGMAFPAVMYLLAEVIMAWPEERLK